MRVPITVRVLRMNERGGWGKERYSWENVKGNIHTSQATSNTTVGDAKTKNGSNTVSFYTNTTMIRQQHLPIF